MSFFIRILILNAFPFAHPYCIVRYVTKGSSDPVRSITKPQNVDIPLHELLNMNEETSDGLHNGNGEKVDAKSSTNQVVLVFATGEDTAKRHKRNLEDIDEKSTTAVKIIEHESRETSLSLLMKSTSEINESEVNKISPPPKNESAHSVTTKMTKSQTTTPATKLKMRDIISRFNKAHNKMKNPEKVLPILASTTAPSVADVISQNHNLTNWKILDPAKAKEMVSKRKITKLPSVLLYNDGKYYGSIENVPKLLELMEKDPENVAAKLLAMAKESKNPKGAATKSGASGSTNAPHVTLPAPSTPKPSQKTLIKRQLISLMEPTDVKRQTIKDFLALSDTLDDLSQNGQPVLPSKFENKILIVTYFKEKNNFTAALQEFLEKAEKEYPKQFEVVYAPLGSEKAPSDSWCALSGTCAAASAKQQNIESDTVVLYGGDTKFGAYEPSAELEKAIATSPKEVAETWREMSADSNTVLAEKEKNAQARAQAPVFTPKGEYSYKNTDFGKQVNESMERPKRGSALTPRCTLRESCGIDNSHQPQMFTAAKSQNIQPETVEAAKNLILMVFGQASDASIPNFLKRFAHFYDKIKTGNNVEVIYVPFGEENDEVMKTQIAELQPDWFYLAMPCGVRSAEYHKVTTSPTVLVFQKGSVIGMHTHMENLQKLMDENPTELVKDWKEMASEVNEEFFKPVTLNFTQTKIGKSLVDMTKFAIELSELDNTTVEVPVEVLNLDFYFDPTESLNGFYLNAFVRFMKNIAPKNVRVSGFRLHEDQKVNPKFSEAIYAQVIWPNVNATFNSYASRKISVLPAVVFQMYGQEVGRISGQDSLETLVRLMDQDYMTVFEVLEYMARAFLALVPSTPVPTTLKTLIPNKATDDFDFTSKFASQTSLRPNSIHSTTKFNLVSSTHGRSTTKFPSIEASATTNKNRESESISTTESEHDNGQNSDDNDNLKKFKSFGVQKTANENKVRPTTKA